MIYFQFISFLFQPPAAKKCNSALTEYCTGSLPALLLIEKANPVPSFLYRYTGNNLNEYKQISYTLSSLRFLITTICIFLSLLDPRTRSSSFPLYLMGVQEPPIGSCALNVYHFNATSENLSNKRHT